MGYAKPVSPSDLRGMVSHGSKYGQRVEKARRVAEKANQLDLSRWAEAVTRVVQAEESAAELSEMGLPVPVVRVKLPSQLDAACQAEKRAAFVSPVVKTRESMREEERKRWHREKDTTRTVPLAAERKKEKELARWQRRYGHRDRDVLALNALVAMTEGE